MNKKLFYFLAMVVLANPFVLKKATQFTLDDTVLKLTAQTAHLLFPKIWRLNYEVAFYEIFMGITILMIALKLILDLTKNIFLRTSEMSQGHEALVSLSPEDLIWIQGVFKKTKDLRGESGLWDKELEQLSAGSLSQKDNKQFENRLDQ